jgi:hypothetical protein
MQSHNACSHCLHSLSPGLKKRKSGYSKLGLYNGHEFVFTESDWEVITFAKLTWRYGYGAIKLHNYVGDMLNNFEK